MANIVQHMRQKQVIEKAYAKINLVLRVTGKRADGYHDLLTVFQSLALHDVLTFSQANPDEIILETNLPGLSTAADNLVWRAAVKLKNFYGVREGVHIKLQKNIPVAAGLGGGSSNAAAALRGLLRFWRLPREWTVLQKIAVQLGSDVPFCLQGGTALGTGRGEKLRTLKPLPFFYVVLANPGFAVSTAAVYQALGADEIEEGANISGMLQAIEAGNRQDIISHLSNTLELPAFRLYPEIKTLKEEMEKTGAVALMSGSGATVFALFTTKQAATAAKAALEKKAQWVHLTKTYAGSGPEVNYV
ncbi:MAG: 4-(cytidine 5'-diphospho)-2-C-methyl-D-erythritol kinase [Firmicutes bacterium]|nr:4-(cytidine 5'-diphospho)-2-C-methyl-D-erythritol kinase [Bacillota bacterium]